MMMVGKICQANPLPRWLVHDGLCPVAKICGMAAGKWGPDCAESACSMPGWHVYPGFVPANAVVRNVKLASRLLDIYALDWSINYARDPFADYQNWSDWVSVFLLTRFKPWHLNIDQRYPMAVSGKWPNDKWAKGQMIVLLYCVLLTEV